MNNIHNHIAARLGVRVAENLVAVRPQRWLQVQSFLLAPMVLRRSRGAFSFSLLLQNCKTTLQVKQLELENSSRAKGEFSNESKKEVTAGWRCWLQWSSADAELQGEVTATERAKKLARAEAARRMLRDKGPAMTHSTAGKPPVPPGS